MTDSFRNIVERTSRLLSNSVAIVPHLSMINGELEDAMCMMGAHGPVPSDDSTADTAKLIAGIVLHSSSLYNNG